MYNLKNYMEAVVNKKMDSILNLMNICKCEKCRMDIMAIALNDVPPKYVVTDEGELFSKVRELEQQFEVDIEMAIVKAAICVSKKPKH
jgi:competence protein ComFB